MGVIQRHPTHSITPGVTRGLRSSASPQSVSHSDRPKGAVCGVTLWVPPPASLPASPMGSHPPPSLAQHHPWAPRGTTPSPSTPPPTPQSPIAAPHPPSYGSPPHLQTLAGVMGGPHAVWQPQHPVLSIATQRLRPHLPLQQHECQHPWVPPTHVGTQNLLPPVGTHPQPRIPADTHGCPPTPTGTHGNP